MAGRASSALAAWRSFSDRLLSAHGGGIDGRALAIFRLILGFSVWFEGRENVKRLVQYTEGQYHVRYFGLELDWRLDQLHALCDWQMRFAVALALGVFGRVAALGALVCQASLFAVSQLNFRNHVFLMLVLLALTAASQCDRAWSVDALVRRAVRRPLPRTVDPLAPRLIQLQILFVYFYSGLHKLVLGFGNGYALCRYLGRELPRGRSGELLSAEQLSAIAGAMGQEACSERVPPIVLLGAIGTIVVELLLAVAFGVRRAVFVAALAGLCLHGVIFVSMDVVTFGLMMVATYPLFVASPPWTAAFGRRER